MSWRATQEESQDVHKEPSAQVLKQSSYTFYTNSVTFLQKMNRRELGIWVKSSSYFPEICALQGLCRWIDMRPYKSVHFIRQTWSCSPEGIRKTQELMFFYNVFEVILFGNSSRKKKTLNTYREEYSFAPKEGTKPLFLSKRCVCAAQGQLHKPVLPLSPLPAWR